MQLILMRHAQAGPYVPDDAHRQLTKVGQAQALDSGNKLSSLYRPELLIVSPYDRARQTAEIVLECYQAKNHHIDTIICNNITPDDDPKFGLDCLYDICETHRPGSVLVVCHMPIVARMGALLTQDYYPHGFELAEFRVYQTPHIVQGLGKEVQRYYPVANL